MYTHGQSSTCMHIHTQTHIHKHIQTHIPHIHMHTQTHIHMCIQTHKYTQTYRQTHTHAHTRMRKSIPAGLSVKSLDHCQVHTQSTHFFLRAETPPVYLPAGVLSPRLSPHTLAQIHPALTSMWSWYHSWALLLRPAAVTSHPSGVTRNTDPVFPLVIRKE